MAHKEQEEFRTVLDFQRQQLLVLSRIKGHYNTLNFHIQCILLLLTTFISS